MGMTIRCKQNVHILCSGILCLSIVVKHCLFAFVKKTNSMNDCFEVTVGNETRQLPRFKKKKVLNSNLNVLYHILTTCDET